MERTLVLFLTVFSSVACDETLKFLTWNLLAPVWVEGSIPEMKDEGFNKVLMDVNVRLATQIDILKRVKPDVMCFQESELYQYNVLKDELSEYMSIFTPHDEKHWASYLNGLEYTPNGNAIFYRKDKFHQRHFEEFILSDNGNTAPLALLGLNNVNFTFVIGCLHFEPGFGDANRAIRLEQARTMSEKTDKMASTYGAGMAVLMGDSNATPPVKTNQILRENGFIDSFKMAEKPHKPTYMSKFYKVTIDYVYLKSNQGTKFEVMDTDVANINDDSLATAEAHKETMARLSEKILRYKTNAESYKRISGLSIINGILGFFNWLFSGSSGEEDRLRIFRMGSDHLYVYADVKIKFE